MKKYRPYGALRRLPPIDILYSFDALTLALPPSITEHYQNHYLCYIVI